MPTFMYEAMDNKGMEVKDTIEAATEQEAQSKIRERGFYVTKISEKGRTKKKDASVAKDGKKNPTPARRERSRLVG